MLAYPQIFWLNAWRCEILTGIASQDFSLQEVLRDILKHEHKSISVKIFRLIQLKFEHVKLCYGVQESKFQSCYSFNIFIYLPLFEIKLALLWQMDPFTYRAL